MRRLLIGACCIALTGCGSSSTQPRAASNGEASKPPHQILADSAAAMRATGNYVMHLSVSHGGQHVDIKFTLTALNMLEITYAVGQLAADMIALPTASYIRANAAYWTRIDAPVAARLANRWITAPASAAQQLVASAGGLSPPNLSRCMLENVGTLTRQGTTTVNGRPAVTLRQAGNVPGSTPGLLEIATTGPPYLLQATATGGTRPGGAVDVCNDAKGSDVTGVITLTAFGHVPAVHAPAGAVSPAQALR